MKHFIDISDFNAKKINAIIAKAKQIKKNPKKFANKFKDKTLGMIFQKESTTPDSFSSQYRMHAIASDNKIGALFIEKTLFW